MTVIHQVYAFLLTVSFLGIDSKADNFSSVSEISYSWIDPFTVNVSWTWERPGNLPSDCEVKYEFDPGESRLPLVRTQDRHYNVIYLTGETGLGQWEIKIKVVGNTKSCENWTSNETSKTVITKKPTGQLVKDFKCVWEPSGMNCSWIPLNPALRPTLSHRLCEDTKENIKSLKRCDHQYNDGIRNGCYLKDKDVCVLMETDSELQTFKPALVIPLPKMSIKENRDRLHLTWMTPDVAKNCAWDYHVCYSECGTSRECLTIQIQSKSTEEDSLQIAYDDRCRYEFEYTVKSGHYCKEISSDGSGYMTYGINRTPEQPLRSTIVIASILSIIFSVSLVLSCYCFKRHRDIFCPNIPDPSAMFKEMMVNGSKDVMSAPCHLYTPMPEAVERCKLTLATENSALQENSGRTLC
ncbi:unnamed protein product [Ophioblennius macclurei]